MSVNEFLLHQITMVKENGRNYEIWRQQNRTNPPSPFLEFIRGMSSKRNRAYCNHEAEKFIIYMHLRSKELYFPLNEWLVRSHFKMWNMSLKEKQERTVLNEN